MLLRLFTHVSGLDIILVDVFMRLMTWLFEVYATYPLRCFVGNFYACCFGEFVEDVTSIS